ncbi:putative signal transducing protein [Brevundimonas sp. GCM10030266]
MSITEIARFADVYEAEIAAARLRSEGFDPVLGGAEHAKTNTLALLALGGVNLSVPDKQVEAARALLDRLRAGEEGIEDEAAEAQDVRSARPRGLGPVLFAVAVGLGILLTLTGWERAPMPYDDWVCM